VLVSSWREVGIEEGLVMKKKHLMEAFEGLPDDADIELSKLMAFDDEEMSNEYTVILDYPILGIAYNKDSNEIRFVVAAEDDSKAMLMKFGQVICGKPDDEKIQ